MKIGFDAKRIFLNFTGLGNYGRETLRILSSVYTDDEYLLYTPKTASHPSVAFIENAHNIHVKTPRGRFSKTSGSLWRSFGLAKQLGSDSLDLYHGLSHELPYFIAQTGIRSIVTIHDLIFLKHPVFYPAIDRFVYLRKIRHACDSADRIISVSRQTRDDLISLLNVPEEKIRVVHQGCHPAFHIRQPASTLKSVSSKYRLPDRYLLNVGTIEERKNLLNLLRALEQLPEPRLVVIGKGAGYLRQCRDYIAEKRMEERVLFLQGVPHEDLPAIYQNALAFIYPSIVEGFGIPILEALSCNIPVITSHGGCFMEAGGPASLYVDPLNVDEIAEAILGVEQDSELRNRMISEGAKHASGFHDQTIARNLMNVYRETLDDPQ